MAKLHSRMLMFMRCETLIIVRH